MINVNGINIDYKKSGSGEALILLHGNGEDHSIFAPLIQKFHHNYTVYAVDSRNHGLSEKTTVYDYKVMADDIYALIMALAIDPVNIIGFSDGAIVSLLLALHDQSVISKMALLGVNLSPADFNAETFEFMQQYYEQTGDPLYKMMLKQPQIDISSLKDVTVPAFVIGAEKDIYHPEVFSSIAEALPHSKLKIVPDHDHGSYIVNNDLLYSELADFFSNSV